MRQEGWSEVRAVMGPRAMGANLLCPPGLLIPSAPWLQTAPPRLLWPPQELITGPQVSLLCLHSAA